MKSFLYRFLGWFILPLLILFLFELIFKIKDSSFKSKANLFKQNKSKIEVLFLGSSHVQNGVNPEWLNVNACNLSYGGQDLNVDKMLLQKYENDLSNLKLIFADLSYIALDSYNVNNPRQPLYSYYYNLEFENISPFTRVLNKNFIFLSNPMYYLKLLKKNISSKSNVNKYGFQLNSDYNNPFKLLNYDTTLIKQIRGDRFMKNHIYEIPENVMYNKTCIEDIVDICINKNVKLIFIAPPVSTIYAKYMVLSKKNRRDEYAKDLIQKYPNIVYFMNFENDPLFNITDFRDEDHLNVSGAHKFTLMLNDSIKALLN